MTQSSSAAGGPHHDGATLREVRAWCGDARMRGGTLFRSGEAVQTAGASSKERCCVTRLSAGPEIAAFWPGAEI